MFSPVAFRQTGFILVLTVLAVLAVRGTIDPGSINYPAVMVLAAVGVALGLSSRKH